MRAGNTKVIKVEGAKLHEKINRTLARLDPKTEIHQIGIQNECLAYIVISEIHKAKTISIAEIMGYKGESEGE